MARPSEVLSVWVSSTPPATNTCSISLQGTHTHANGTTNTSRRERDERREGGRAVGLNRQHTDTNTHARVYTHTHVDDTTNASRRERDGEGAHSLNTANQQVS